jgi:hypothetical protein
MDISLLKSFIYKEFDNNALPALMDYVRIPNLSRSYDPQWNSNGLLEQAAVYL